MLHTQKVDGVTHVYDERDHHLGTIVHVASERRWMVDKDRWGTTLPAESFTAALGLFQAKQPGAKIRSSLAVWA